jgi:hypothetical protein
MIVYDSPDARHSGDTREIAPQFVCLYLPPDYLQIPQTVISSFHDATRKKANG